MNKIKGILFLLLFVILACKQKTADNHQHTEASVIYTCPMHPQIIQDKPGICPICNMDLVKTQFVNSDEIILDENQIKLANIKTQKLGTSNYENSKLLNARVIANPENVYTVASKFNGRVDKLYYQEVGVFVNKGALLYKIYSEDLLSMQKEYLLNKKLSNEFPDENIYKKLFIASKNKLELYGLNQQQIARINDKNTQPYISVYAQNSGIITEISITEGEYLSEGMPVLRMEDLSNIWVEAHLYSNEISNVKVGNAITIQVENFEPQKAKVDFLSPQLNANSQIITLRASLNNTNNKYLIGMKATVKLIRNSSKDALSLPTNAVIRNNEDTYVWVKENDSFKRKEVEISSENENSVLIKSGLNNGEEVVVSGTYLLDSELKLRKGKNN
ncbi:efflux RND transporter periplasmic adaptor subunit [Pedobacter alpinus]|uniref:Efflux RND transporter periplasmic adaptor subunit n=1 Tax=Pedobacter alpinus TaxID=1590643 RepID=A0ABW5TUE5_9SPHI